MATQSTTKTELSTSTALTRGNVSALKVPTDYVVEAQRAIAENKKGGELLGSAEQRMAYAIMVYCLVLRQTSQTTATLDKAIVDSVERGFLKPHCLDKFIGEAPKRDKDIADSKRDALRTTKTIRSTATSMFNRAFELAVLLVQDGVTHNQFKHQIGNFEVPSKTLMPKLQKGAVPMFRLAENDWILLDGRGIHYVGKNMKGEKKTFEVNASIAHYKMCHRTKVNTRAGKTAEEGASVKTDMISKITPEDLANGAEFKTVLYAAYRQFCRDGTGEPCRKEDMTEDMANWLSAISKKWLADTSTPEWEKGTFMVDAVKKAKADKAKATRAAKAAAAA